MRIIAGLVIALLLTGCAAQMQQRRAVENARAYIQENKPRAQRGEILWSTYWKSMYNYASIAGATPDALERVNEAIRTSEALEKGDITKSDFEFKMRSLDAQDKAASLAQAAEREQRASNALALAAQMLQAGAPTQMPMQQQAQFIQSAQPAQAAQVGVTAYFTGQQKQVQTVTYQYGWNCEYRYLAQTFWRTVVGSCPPTIQIQ